VTKLESNGGVTHEYPRLAREMPRFAKPARVWQDRISGRVRPMSSDQ